MVKVPADWENCTLNDFLSIQRGASPRPIDKYLTSSRNSVNWIKIGDAPKNGKYITHANEQITLQGASYSVRVKKMTLFCLIQ